MHLSVKKIGISLLSVCLLSLFACSNIETSSAQALTAKAFSDKLDATPLAQLIDVRTPGEFNGGYIKNAVNMDWNNVNFSKEATKLDKNNPVFVYCLSGGRSAAAAASLRKSGFKEVIELQGGIMAWQAANLPLSNLNEREAGMSMTDYEKLLDTNEKVLVDFYAAWCAPCKKMKPYLDEISQTMKGEVKVIRIDIEANPELTKRLNITSIPVLHLYEHQKLTWENTGYIEKEEVVKILTK